MIVVVFIAIAGAVGATVRSSIADVVGSHEWPVATMTANTIASFAIGLAPGGSTVLTVGLLGALSTWSTLALEILELHRRRGLGFAMAVAAASIVLGVGATWLGLQLG